MKQSGKLFYYVWLSLGLHAALILLLLLIGYQAAPLLVEPEKPNHHLLSLQEPSITTMLIPLQSPAFADNNTQPNQQNEPDSPFADASGEPPSQRATGPKQHHLQAETEVGAMESEQEKGDEKSKQQETLEESKQKDVHFPELNETRYKLAQAVAEEHRELLKQQIQKLAKVEPQPPRIEQQPKKRSILEMTAGFLKSQQTAGNSLMERDGENKMPSFEELQYLSYQRQIDEAVMNSWRMVRSQRRNRPNSRSNRPVHFSYEVNEDGSLANLKLIQSSGDYEFDRLVLASIRHAAPFPPIPKHLGIKKYRPVGGTYRVSW